MSTAAVFSAERAQACVLSAVREVLRRLHPEVAARWLDCSTDTVERVISGAECEGRWTTARTCRLVAAERSVLGTRRLGMTISELFGSIEITAAKSVSTEVRSSIPILCDLIKDESEAVVDGVVNEAEARRIGADCDVAIEQLHQLRKACTDRLGRVSP